MAFDHIGLAKAILWEEAKGKLRALVAAAGQQDSTMIRNYHWAELEIAVDKFIKEVEDHGWHE